MTVRSDLKTIIRTRMSKTGESYTAARAHVLREQERLLGPPDDQDQPDLEAAKSDEVEAVVIKLNQQSARVRVLGETEAITFRSSATYRLVPGHIVELTITKRWTYRGHEYASGAVGDSRFDIERLELTPLSLTDQDIYDLRETSEPFTSPDPFAPYWEALTETPRRAYEFDAIAWDAIAARSDDFDITPVVDAAELHDQDPITARELLMDVLAEDLRCIDAHAHLGNLRFDYSPEDAMAHYEVGITIGELSLGTDFEELLPWGYINNRPFLRCLHGYALCLWQLSRFDEAEQMFWRILTLNPTDNQGARFCWHAVRRGMTWEDFQDNDPDDAIDPTDETGAGQYLN